MLGALKGAFDAPSGSPGPVPPVTYRSFDDVSGQRDAIYSNALRGVRALKPVENEKYRVEISNPDYAQDYNPSLSDEKKALMARQSMQRAIKGNVRLIDKASGQVVDETETTLAHVPHLTPRGIFVRGGTIWAAKNQQRLRPGVFVLRQQNGDVKAQVNPKPGSGRGFDLQLEPSTGVFKLNVGQSGTRLYPLLRSMGVPDDAIKAAWGDELFKLNWRPPGGHDAQEARKIVAKMGRRGDQEVASEALKDKLHEILGRAELDEETTETTLGTKYKNFNIDTMLNATSKMLKRSRDEVPDDVRDSQAFQSFHGPEDFFEERLSRGGDAMRKLLWRATREGNLGNVSPGLLNPAVDSVFQSGLMASVEDTNPMEIMDARQTITRLGEGGISSNQAVPRSARGVQPSYFGIIDPIRAPEGQNIGVDMRVTDGALKGSDGRLYFKVRSRKGEDITLSALQASKKPIAFPGEFAKAAKRELYKVPLMGANGKYEDHVVDMNDIANDPEISASVGMHGLGKPLPPMVRVLDGEDIKWKPATEVDYELPHGSSMFSRLTNMVPMTQGAKSQRTLMGARMSVTGDTPVLIRRDNGEHYYGLIEDYVHAEGDCAVSVDKTTSKVIWRRVRALDKHLNVKRIKKVTLKSGRHVNATDDHSFVTIGEDGGLTKVHTQDLTRGVPVPIVGKIPDSRCDRTDWVVAAGRKHNAYPTAALPLNYETGWVHGMYIAEGSLVHAHRDGHKFFASAVSFANCDSDVLNKLFEYFRNIGVNASVLSGRVDGKMDKVNVCWAQFASAISSDYGAGAYNKVLPGWVFFAPLEFRRGLLAGYLAGDGGVQPRRDAVRVNGSSRSGKLIDGFVNLCATMGIMCNRSATHVMTGPGGSHAIQHYFEVRTEHVSRLPTLHCERKDLRIRAARWSGKKSADWFPRWPNLDASLRAHTRRGSREYKRIYSNQLTRESVRTLLGEDAASIAWLDSDVWWDRVESIEELDVKQYTYVYDLDMEDNVFMCGACVVVHNTSQALPLQSPEAPLVQASNPDGNSIHDSMGVWMGAVKAKAPGRVVAVTPDHIDVVYAGGKKERHELYNNYPLARKTSLHNTPLVREGDAFKPGDVLAKSNFTDDKGQATMGANFNVGYMVGSGHTYEDGFKISESTARRLSSQHAYKHELELDKHIHSTKKADYSSIFQGKYKPEQISSIDDDGVIKEGAIVQPGDPVLLAVRKKTPRPGGVVTPSARSAFADASQTWDHSTPGQVTDVVRTRKGIKVMISSVEPMTEGSKLTARYGNKGVVSQIVPDGEMPIGPDGKPLDIIVNSLGVISRANPSVLAETLLGKVARKTGKPYVLKSFDHDDLGDFALNEAKVNGITELDDVTDPKTGHKIKGIFTGVQHLMRLHHTAESGLAARDTGGYTSDDSPAKGGPEGSKKIALLGVQCLLSAGATNVLKDAKLIRGQRNDDYWRSVKLGMDPAMPEASGAHGHFLDLLKGAGVNVRENQGRLKLAPMTDADTDALAPHSVSSSETFDFETMQPKDGGLFDLAKTGGADGRHFTRIELPQKIPNPVMEEPIIRILGLTKQKFLDVLSGQEKIGDKTGPEAIETALKGINVDREIAMHVQGVKTGSKSSRDVHVRALNYLSGLKSAGVDPGDLMISKIPVIPPKFRPVIRAGKMDIIHDANYLYHDLMESGKNYTDAQKAFGDAGEEYGAMYAAAKAVAGLGAPVNPKHVEQGVKGLLQNAIGVGDSPKFARFQRKVLGQAVDSVGRGVATPDPELDMDQVSIPKEMAWTLYRPYVIRRLVRSGWSAREAVMAVREQKPAALRELQAEMKARPVYWDRAPALQRYNYVGAWPVLSKGNNIGVPQVVEPGANLDFDGDKINLHVPSHHSAVQDVIEKMMPSKNLWHPADFDVHLKPDKDYLAGLYLATNVKKDKPTRTFASKEDAYKAYLRGDLGVADPVVILSSHNHK